MCGIYGIIRRQFSNFSDYEMKRLMRGLGIGAEVRGTDATGIAYVDPVDGEVTTVKAPLRANQFPFYKSIPDGVDVLIGHTRASTQGSELKNMNNHPFLGRTKDGTDFALAHNGVLWNDYTLKHEHKLDYEIETDTYVAVALLDKQETLNFENVKNVAEELDGCFMLTILTDRNDLWFVRYDNPIEFIEFKELGLLVYASTKDILMQGIKDVKQLKRYYKEYRKDTNKIHEFTLKDAHIYNYKYTLGVWNSCSFVPTESWYTTSYTGYYKGNRGKYITIGGRDYDVGYDYDFGYNEYYMDRYGMSDVSDWYQDAAGTWHMFDKSDYLWNNVTWLDGGDLVWNNLWFPDEDAYKEYRGVLKQKGKSEADEFYVDVTLAPYLEGRETSLVCVK